MCDFTIRCDRCGSEADLDMVGDRLTKFECRSCDNRFVIPGSEQFGSVYFISGESAESPVKIGFTQGMIPDRLKSLQTGSPEKLSLIGAIAAVPATERALHKLFSAERMHGEWFQRSERLLGLIRAVNTFCSCPTIRDKVI